MARKRVSRRDALWFWVPALLLVVGGFVVAVRFVQPPPPQRLVFAAGPRGGAYHAFAQRYQAILARDRIALEVLETAGSVQNLGLIASGTAHAGFVQGGTAPGVPSGSVAGLASLFYEPLWVFYRGPERIDYLRELQGRRVAIGAAGSGTQALSRQLLEANGLGPSNTELLELAPSAAAQALRAGELDAAFFVLSVGAPIVHQLTRAPDVSLMSFRQHVAYARKLRFLTALELAEGMIDLRAGIPPTDTVLLAATAALAASPELHPALVPLLLRAAREVHGEGGLLEEREQFPSVRWMDLPLDPDAEHYLTQGPALLARYLPFWAEYFLRQASVLLLPIFTLLLPLARWAPSLYRWGIGAKIYRWYVDLQGIEEGVEKNGSLEQLEAALERLRKLSDDVAGVSVPYTYMKDVYELRLHIALVIGELRESKGRLETARKASGTG
jgi:uncharacterized protein